MPKTLQTKCKTCFGGPRTILYGFKIYLNGFLNISIMYNVCNVSDVLKHQSTMCAIELLVQIPT